MEAMTKQLQETQAKAAAAEAAAAEAKAQAAAKEKESAAQIEALMKLVEDNRLARARDNLKSDVNEQLTDNKEKRAGSKEFDEAVKALTKPGQKDLPTSDEVVAKITETREAAKQQAIQERKEIAAKINASMSGLPADASIAQTREWNGRNIQLYKSLSPDGQKAFTNYIQNVYKFQTNRDTFDPQIFFDRKIAEAAVLELKGATRAETFRPLITGPGALQQPVTVYPPDMAKIATVLRSIDDLPQVRRLVQANPEVTSLKDKLPRESWWFYPEDGAFQKSIDARLEGKKVEAEAHLIRALISSGRVASKDQRQEIQEARKADPSQTAAIDEFYKKTYGTDIASEVKAANKAALERAAKADEELKKAQEKAKQAKEATSDIE
jgi:hypothetical protein